MKLRKHKNDKCFQISFQTQTSTVIANKGNVGGWEKCELRPGRVQIINAVGVSEGAVRNGFLFGRDRNNTIIRSIRPA